VISTINMLQVVLEVNNKMAGIDARRTIPAITKKCAAAAVA
jgi:hypothetical protein